MDKVDRIILYFISQGFAIYHFGAVRGVLKCPSVWEIVVLLSLHDEKENVWDKGLLPGNAPYWFD